MITAKFTPRSNVNHSVNNRCKLKSKSEAKHSGYSLHFIMLDVFGAVSLFLRLVSYLVQGPPQVITKFHPKIADF